MNILEKIIAVKFKEVAFNRQETPLHQLRKAPAYTRPVFSLKQYLQDETRTGIIAEFKRKSPSKGIINDKADVLQVTETYTNYGAAGLSVLTDSGFFGGSNADLIMARQNNIPVLRKDFIIDEYQVDEARAIGADVMLLIAACLTPRRVKELAAYANALGLEVLLELHGEDELDHICEEVSLVGINNRNLKTFEVDLERSISMASKLKGEKILIAESGINNVDTILLLKQHGFDGFLIGEYFMKQPDPTIAFVQFVNQLKQKQHEN